MLIALGTDSRYKISTVKMVLAELDVVNDLIPVKVESGVSSQPKQLGEVREGAINRARNAFKKVENADIGLGVEFGYIPVSNQFYKMVCYAAVYTDEKVYYEHSSSLQLPTALQDALEKDLQVSSLVAEVIDAVPGVQLKRAASHYLRKRKPISECVENVMIRLLLSDIWYT